ncbi:hypothetical protein Bhyg_14688 [Pseudolycoriella hygida]|uniref:FAM234A/B beta-propeller domain-containing protein n=1 Tax=Pseudolycoriella hygida TaxID=35572 RepID=A0A9Q0RXI4_9DIPT|nr:hypothetical protein Bhyg_14688 [Pseudolycoriella hygida]
MAGTQKLKANGMRNDEILPNVDKLFICCGVILVVHMSNMPTGDHLPQGHGMYSPLSQNMTDSDSSEEEIHSRRKMPPPELHEIDYSAYSTCRNDDRLLNQNVDDDNVAILPTAKPDRIRLGLVVLSILFCVSTIVIFLTLPCGDESNSCPAMVDRVKTHNWLRSYENIEFKGTIYVVNGLRGRSKNLVAMYRKDKRVGDNETGPRKTNGVISLLGGTGGVSWYTEILNEPMAIDCSLIDVDLNGTPDCLVVDEFGEITCINPLAGTIFWHIADRTEKNTKLLTFPLVLPDLNSDKVNELLVTSSINSLTIVSGRNGQKIGSSYIFKECSFIHKFQLDKNLKFSFICIKNETEVQIVKPLDELYQFMTPNGTIKLNPMQKTQINQHKFYGQRKDTVSQRNIYSVSGKQLIVENNGRCPENCNVSVELIEQKNSRNNIVRNFNGSRMYGMVPAILTFNSSGVDTKSGFVIKFWEWSAQESDVNFHNKPKRSTSNEFNLFANSLKQKRPWKKPLDGEDVIFRYERSMNIQNSSKDSILKSRMRLIKETVILIVFNSTDTKIENTSQSNIIQFCQGEQSDIECQPDLNYQENSLLIADLDQDGSQELVSFYSTYVYNGNDTNDSSNWQLVTYLQLLRLEAELPKLYSTPSDQN